MQNIEAYAATGIVRGAVVEPIMVGTSPEAARPIAVEEATWHPLGTGADEDRGHVRLPIDDVLILWADEHDLPIHARWNPVELEIGPYRLTAELPTQPGFDPGRALSRPGGPFILLRDVRIGLVGDPGAGQIERAHALVNRYAAERVVADIDLGYYFPGAVFAAPVGGQRA
ncbi:MAG: hypothetical protein ABI598_07305 [Chloroflexota bacterium]